MPLDFSMNSPISDDETRERIRSAVERLLREHEEQWQVSIESRPSHSYLWLTAQTGGFERRKLMDRYNLTPPFIAKVLRDWLGEFAWMISRRELPG
ncbi:MAG: hypothetical protein NTZ98_07645 [Acidobacteria bacterium]|jgi:hypothetical protein|nr:hypothetical protein [Acidobacteriota bacterium]